MIEIRVNNGVIEYRHQLELNWQNGVVRKAPAWGEWRKAEYFGRAFTATQEQRLAARANGAQLPASEGVKVWFDEAADINLAWLRATEKAIWEELGVPKGAAITPTGWELAYRKATAKLSGMNRQLKHAEDMLQAERKKVEQRDRQVRVVSAEGDAMAKHIDELRHELIVTHNLHAELGDAHKRMAALQEDNRKLTNANQIVRDQRNRARMESIEAERKRVDTEAMLKTAEQVLLQRQKELDTVRQVLDLTKSEGKHYAFRSGRAREWLQRLVDYVDGNPERSFADLVSGIRQELARKD